VGMGALPELRHRPFTASFSAAELAVADAWLQGAGARSLAGTWLGQQSAPRPCQHQVPRWRGGNRRARVGEQHLWVWEWVWWLEEG